MIIFKLFFSDGKKYQVYLSSKFEQGLKLKGVSFYRHPHFHRYGVYSRFDIGLIKLEKPVTFTYQVDNWLNNLIFLPRNYLQIDPGLHYALVNGWAINKDMSNNEREHLKVSPITVSYNTSITMLKLSTLDGSDMRTCEVTI